MALPSDSDWISLAHQVLESTQASMHFQDIEDRIRVEFFEAYPGHPGPTMSLEVLLTKEAAMGRKFTKPEGSQPGFFSLLPPQVKTEVKTECGLPSSQQSESSLTQLSDQTDSITTSQKYHQKYKQLKKMCKRMIYLNAALYDEIARIERKIERNSNERRSLLTKIMVDQNVINPKDVKGISKSKKDSQDPGSNLTDNPPSTPKSSHKDGGNSRKRRESSSPSTSQQASKKRHVSNKDPSTDQGGIKEENMEAEPKESVAIKIQSVSMDPSGCPIFPIELPAGLTVYSAGEVSTDEGYSTYNCLYPVGYCVTREYASLGDPSQKATFTCKISEGLTGPAFEISADDDEGFVYKADTPDECHKQLLKDICNKLADRELQLSENSDFFGLRHPVVKNMLQSSQGARKCTEYNRCRYELVQDNSQIADIAAENDPTNNFFALIKPVNATGDS